MAKDARKAHGTDVKKTDILLLWPEDVTIVVDPKHPLYDPDRVDLELDETMVLNIMHYGVIETITVTKDTETGKTVVVDGRQRVLHAIEANKRLRKRGEEPIRVPAVPKRGESFRLMGMMMSANVIRRDETPMGKAKKVQRYLELGRSEEEVAIVMGYKSVASVKQALALLEASAPVRRAAEAGKIGIVDAAKLSKLDPDEQKERLDELLALPAPGKSRKGVGRKRREIVNGEPQPRGKREIAKKLETMRAEKSHPLYCEALEWVLGAENQLCAVGLT